MDLIPLTKTPYVPLTANPIRVGNLLGSGHPARAKFGARRGGAQYFQ